MLQHKRISYACQRANEPAPSDTAADDVAGMLIRRINSVWAESERVRQWRQEAHAQRGGAASTCEVSTDARIAEKGS